MSSRKLQPTSIPQSAISPMLNSLAIGQNVSNPPSSANQRPFRKRRPTKRSIADKDAAILFLPPKRPTADFCTVSRAQANLLARQRRCLLLSLARISHGSETHLHDCSSGQTNDVEIQIVSPSFCQIIVGFHDKDSLLKALREIPQWNLATQGTSLNARVSRLAQSQSRSPIYYRKHRGELANLEGFLRDFFTTRDFEKVTDIVTDLQSNARPISGQLTVHEKSRPWLRKLGVGKHGFKEQSMCCRPYDACELCTPTHQGCLDKKTKKPLAKH